MTCRLRRMLRTWHRSFDGLVGRAFSRQPSLRELAGTVTDRPGVENFSCFLYSRGEHFKAFDLLPIYMNQSPASCDLKVYQDLFTYTFIRNNLQPGTRLLEIGGGDSRVIPALQSDYELWNLDKLEGVGFGPRDIPAPAGARLVRDYIGAFNSQLPDGAFDLVFSISTVEHFSGAPEDVRRIIADIQRLLRPGGYSLHCIDGLLYADRLFVHPFLDMAHRELHGVACQDDFKTISRDPDLWRLPKFAYYTRWYHLTRRMLADFGYPFSLNVFWQK
jgi:SAM-dependent methyltransferase